MKRQITIAISLCVFLAEIFGGCNGDSTQQTFTDAAQQKPQKDLEMCPISFQNTGFCADSEVVDSNTLRIKFWKSENGPNGPYVQLNSEPEIHLKNCCGRQPTAAVTQLKDQQNNPIPGNYEIKLILSEEDNNAGAGFYPGQKWNMIILIQDKQGDVEKLVDQGQKHFKL